MFHSDPTYEAWKLEGVVIKPLTHINSDPTYEAWKHSSKTLLIFSSIYSDPTYEAWKLAIDNAEKNGYL